MASVLTSNNEKVEIKPLAWPAYVKLRRLVIRRTEVLTGDDGGVNVIRKAIAAFTGGLNAQQHSEALTDDQVVDASDAEPKVSKFALQLAESLCDVAMSVVKSIGAVNESLDELTELLILSGTTLTEEQARQKLEAWSVTDVLAIRDAIWDATEWDQIRKAELGFFGRMVETLGLGGKAATAE